MKVDSLFLYQHHRQSCSRLPAITESSLQWHPVVTEYRMLGYFQIIFFLIWKVIYKHIKIYLIWDLVMGESVTAQLVAHLPAEPVVMGLNFAMRRIWKIALGSQSYDCLRIDVVALRASPSMITHPPPSPADVKGFGSWSSQSHTDLPTCWARHLLLTATSSIIISQLLHPQSWHFLNYGVFYQQTH